MIAKYDGKCRKCGAVIHAGDSIRYSNLTKQTFCVPCWGTKGQSAHNPARDEQPAASAMAAIMERATAAHAAARAEQSEQKQSEATAAYERATSGQEMAPEAAPAAPAPVETSNGSAAYLAPLAAALAQHMNLPAAAMDAAAVTYIVRNEIAKLEAPAPTIIEVRRPDAPAVTIEGAHYLMPRLLRLMVAGIHVYLWGPAGTGKTTAVLQAAHALGKTDSEIDTLDPSTPKSGIMGYRTPTGDPVSTAFTRCYVGGQVYVGDELDNAPAAVQSIMNSALANGHAPTAWGMVPRGDGFVFGGTGNTPGRPTPSYPDRRPMSAAFADRLYFLHWPLDAAIECRVGGLKTPPAPVREEGTCTPGEWVRWVQRIRVWAAEHAPTLQVTPRASILGVQCLAIGETPTEVAHGLVFRGADAAMVTKALAAVPLPG